MEASEIASALGKRAKGKPKTLTPLERERRRVIGIARLRSWHEKQGHKIRISTD